MPYLCLRRGARGNRSKQLSQVGPSTSRLVVLGSYEEGNASFCRCPWTSLASVWLGADGYFSIFCLKDKRLGAAQRQTPDTKNCCRCHPGLLVSISSNSRARAERYPADLPRGGRIRTRPLPLLFSAADGNGPAAHAYPLANGDGHQRNLDVESRANTEMTGYECASTASNLH